MIKNFFLFATLAATVAGAEASNQYLCEFGSEVAITNNDPQNPRIKVISDSSRFTFVETPGEIAGSYMNLRDGQLLPIYVVRKSALITFVERHGTDNGFAISIFLSKGTSSARPAVFSQHSYTVDAKDHDFFVPKTSTGSCRVVNSR
jgi:hypothetical protein